MFEEPQLVCNCPFKGLCLLEKPIVSKQHGHEPLWNVGCEGTHNCKDPGLGRESIACSALVVADAEGGGEIAISNVQSLEKSTATGCNGYPPAGAEGNRQSMSSMVVISEMENGWAR